MAFGARIINPIDFKPSTALGVSILFNAPGVFNSTYVSKDAIKNNLIKLKNHSQSIGSQPIFVTQRSLRWKKQDNIIMSIDNYDYYSYEKKVSETIINFCKENKIICVNLFEEFSLTESDTYDLVHLNKIGAKKQALIIFNNIKNISF